MVVVKLLRHIKIVPSNHQLKNIAELIERKYCFETYISYVVTIVMIIDLEQVLTAKLCQKWKNTPCVQWGTTVYIDRRTHGYNVEGLSEVWIIHGII